MVAVQKLTNICPVSLEQILSSDTDPWTETLHQSENILQKENATPQKEEILGQATTKAHFKEQVHHVNLKEGDTPGTIATASTGAATVIVTTPSSYDRYHPLKTAASGPDYLVASLIVLLFTAVLGPWIERSIWFFIKVSWEKFFQSPMNLSDDWHEPDMISVTIDVDDVFAHSWLSCSPCYSGDPLIKR